MPLTRNFNAILPPEEFRANLMMLVGSEIAIRCPEISEYELEASIKGPILIFKSFSKIELTIDLRDDVYIKNKDELYGCITLKNTEYTLEFEDPIERDGVIFQICMWKGYWKTLIEEESFELTNETNSIYLKPSSLIAQHPNFILFFSRYLDYSNLRRSKQLMNSSTRQQKELKKEISLAKKLEEESQKKIRDHESKAKSFEKQEEVSDRLLILKEENNFLLNALVNSRTAFGGLDDTHEETIYGNASIDIEQLEFTKAKLEESEREIHSLSNENSYLKRMLMKMKKESLQENPNDISQNTEIFIRLVNLEKENEDLRRELEAQETQIIKKALSNSPNKQGMVLDKNLTMANILVNKLTEEIATKTAKIEELELRLGS